MITKYRQTIGRYGEDKGVEFLERHDFSILARNYHTTVGELDIVAKRGSDFYFVEVKTRQDHDFATDLAVTGLKLRRLRKTVARYCYEYKISGGIIVAVLVVWLRQSQGKINFRLVPIY